MTIADHHDQTGYGAVLRREWPQVGVRAEHPRDGSWIYSAPTPFTADEPPLLLLHGVGNDGGIYGPILPVLAERRPVYAPTLSPELLVAETVAEVAADVAGEAGDDASAEARARLVEPLVGWLAEVTPPPWRLVGHSMGGVITGLLLRTRPDLVERAVLLNSPLPGTVRRIHDGDTLDRAGRALLALKALSRITAFGRPRLPRVLRGAELAIVRNALRGFVDDPGALDDRVISRAIVSTRTRDGSEFLQLARELPDWHAEPFTGRPVSIVLGENDPLVPSSDLDGVRAMYPDADVRVLAECAHFAHLEQPGAVVDAIDEFVAG